MTLSKTALIEASRKIKMGIIIVFCFFFNTHKAQKFTSLNLKSSFDGSPL